MTKEEIEHNHIKEIAEEYIKKNNLEWELECNRTSSIGEVKQAFLAGFKACRPKWHKVADGDLPKENKRYLCKIKGFVGSGISYECFDYDTEYSSWKNACGDVIEWCEIPKYTEE